MQRLPELASEDLEKLPQASQDRIDGLFERDASNGPGIGPKLDAVLRHWRSGCLPGPDSASQTATWSRERMSVRASRRCWPSRRRMRVPVPKRKDCDGRPPMRTGPNECGGSVPSPHQGRSGSKPPTVVVPSTATRKQAAFLPRRDSSRQERRNSRRARLNSPGHSRLLTCPAPGITTSWDLGMACSNWWATLSGDRTSCSPQISKVGTAM